MKPLKKTFDQNLIFGLLLVLIILLGAYFRLFNLGALGFWGDEETSSIPARSLAQNSTAQFASGMEYRRAIPHTYLSAASAQIFGIEKDLSYRVPSAIFGIATLLIFFLFTKHFLGIEIAIVACMFLAFSEWHIILSRTARMYGPLLFFSILFSYYSLKWHFSKNLAHLMLACSFYLIAVTFNFLAIVALPIIVLPVLLRKFEKTSFLKTLSISFTLAAISVLYSQAFVAAPYRQMQLTYTALQPISNTLAPSGFALLEEFTNSDLIVFLLAMTTVIIVVRKVLSQYTTDINLPNYPVHVLGITVFSICACLFLFMGKSLGSIICVFFTLILLSVSQFANTRLLIKLLLGFLLLLSITLFYQMFSYGIASGIKQSLNYPFPYILYLAQRYPGIMVLFFVGALTGIFNSKSNSGFIIQILSIAVILPLFALGLFKDWAPPRYFVTVYPLLLIVSAYGIVNLVKGITWIKSERIKTAFILLITSSGIIGDHGLYQAISLSKLNYGENFFGNHLSGIRYPDHRSHGCLVKSLLKDDDIVVAEDALQMYWYIGRVDYWLRNPSNIEDFFYFDGEKVRDFYVNSIPTTETEINFLKENKKNRIWVITSGETRQFTKHFIQEGTVQEAWLDNIQQSYQPVLEGKDGLSATYCINCDTENNSQIKTANVNFSCETVN